MSDYGDSSLLVLLGIILVPATVTFIIFTVARWRRYRFHHRPRHPFEAVLKAIRKD